MGLAAVFKAHYRCLLISMLFSSLTTPRLTTHILVHPLTAMRLDKFICKSTELSRTEAHSSIQTRAIRVNGDIVTDARIQVHENNCITLEGQELCARPSRYIMVHKPLDTICSNVDEAYPSLLNTIDLDDAADLHVTGRLDADTTGLVLVTDDGRWSFNIIRPQQQCEKVYRVHLRRPIAANAVHQFARGLQLQGEKSLTQPAKLAIVNPSEVLLTLTEGKFHQVKRMFKAVGNRVEALHRQRIGSLSLDIDLAQWRHLTAEEVASFK
jgi:16S rRNA pseudouridine516 synthase